MLASVPAARRLLVLAGTGAGSCPSCGRRGGASQWIARDALGSAAVSGRGGGVSLASGSALARVRSLAACVAALRSVIVAGACPGVALVLRAGERGASVAIATPSAITDTPSADIDNTGHSDHRRGGGTITVSRG